jgi:Domain of unknown function (DUF4258)
MIGKLYKTKMAKIIPIQLSDKAALGIARECAKYTSRVMFCGHALQQMKKRGITAKQVKDCLLKGRVYEPVHRDIKGDWRMTIEHQMSCLTIRVAIAIKYNGNGEKIIVVTAF